MPIALIAKDAPESLDKRMENRPAHLDYLTSSGDLILHAGPLLNDEQSPIGSLIVLGTDDMQQAEDWAAADPYAKADLFASVELIRWNKVIG